MMDFEFKKTKLDGVLLITPFFHSDMRGYFIKDYSTTLFESQGITRTIKECFYTTSKRNVIRGIHFQFNHPQSKIVSCIVGEIRDVVVDLRPESVTYGQYEIFDLNEDNHNELYIPAGFGHGFYCVNDSIVCYKCDELFDKSGDSGIRYDDLDLRINWNISDEPIVSDKDKSLMSFNEFRRKYPRGII